MKGLTKFLLPVFSISLASCAFVKTFEEDLAFKAVVAGEVVDEGVINIFNNAVLPTVPDTLEDKIFYKWYIGEGEIDIKQTERLLPEEGLLRYNDHAKYAVNNVLTVQAVYFTSEEFPSPYLTVRWYSKTSTSGLDEETIENWTPALYDFLTENGASEEDIAEVDIKGYAGQVGDFGAAVNKDKVVDIVLGVGNNIDSTGKVKIKEKTGGIMMNGISRYIARLNDKPTTIAVYEWLKTEAGHAKLTK